MIKTTVSRLSAQLAAVSATIGLAVSPIALQAQEAQESPEAEGEAAPSAALNPLGIPANFSLFGEPNPNVRKATAVVNGAVITGTDVDHRTNMVLASAQSQIGDAELIQLRMRVLRNLIDETLQVLAQRPPDAPSPKQNSTDGDQIEFLLLKKQPATSPCQ